MEALAKENKIAEKKEPFFKFEASALKRVGVILRLVAIPVAIIALIVALILPTVAIDYASYSGSTTFPADRAEAFIPELIPGYLCLFGGDYFYYYLEFKDGPIVLNTALAQLNVILLVSIVILFLNMAFSVLITFSKKLDKYSKVIPLLYFIVGLVVLASPVTFMVTNSFGNTGAVGAGDAAHYIIYDSLYVHSAYGAIISFAIFCVSAVLWSVGTNFEMAGGDNRSGEE